MEKPTISAVVDVETVIPSPPRPFSRKSGEGVGEEDDDPEALAEGDAEELSIAVKLCRLECDGL